jgi:hypothetical protein
VSRLSFKLSLLLGAALVPHAVQAGAWLMPEGHGQIVVTGTASQATRSFDNGGGLQATPRYSKDELNALLEYGVTGWLTAIATPSLQHVDIAPPTGAQRTGFGNSEFGARALIAHGDSWGNSWVLSAQGTVLAPGTVDNGNPAALGYTGVDIDLRGLLGASFTLGGWPAFVDLQLAQRFRTGGPPSEMRADVTFGLRAAARWLLLAQAFNVVSEGSGDPLFPQNRYHKLQMSVIYNITPQWALQGGAFTTFAGSNSVQENGLLAGVWYRF